MNARLNFVLLPLFAAIGAWGAVSDYTRTVISTAYNGYEGATFVKWEKLGSKPYGRAWAFKFDLTKGFRMRAWLGDGAGNKATVGTMAERLCSEGETPVAGINADYFYTKYSTAEPTGFVISDSRLVHRGADPDSARRMYVMETADHSLVHGVPDYAGPSAENPMASWQLTFKGRKIRNALRTNWCNYPVRDGKIYQIGNVQDRDGYPRVLVGFGTNELGHEMLVIFLNDGRQSDWSTGVSDVDSAQMMIDEGCSEVGEFDGGGSATLWSLAGSDAVYNASSLYRTTAHGGYVNRPSDIAPRSVACGLFVLAPREHAVRAKIGEIEYETVDEARAAAAPGESVWVFPQDADIRPLRRERPVPWFSCDAVAGLLTGGAWSVAPERTDGWYEIRNQQPGTFLAEKPTDRSTRVRTTMSFRGGFTDLELEAMLTDFSTCAPKSVVTVREKADFSLEWVVLVREQGSLRWRTLTGPVVKTDVVHDVVQEIDRTGSVAKVSYLMDGERLADNSGTSWFDPPSDVDVVDGVSFSGWGRVSSFEAFWGAKDGTTIFLR